MTKKKERKSKFVHGGNIVWFQGRDDHIACRTDDDDHISISGDMLFKMLNRFDFQVEQWGENWRVTSFEEKPYDAKDVLIDCQTVENI